jgi:hypothetical protein
MACGAFVALAFFATAPRSAAADPAIAADSSDAPDGGRDEPAPIPGACGAGSLCAPPVVDPWPHGAPAPAGYHLDSRPNEWLIGVGSGMVGVPFVAHCAFLAGVRALSNDDYKGPLLWLLLPVGGPFVLLHDAQNPALQAVLIADGTIQAAGVGLWLLGLVWRRPVLVRDERSALRFLPMPSLVGGSAPGLGYAGTF